MKELTSEQERVLDFVHAYQQSRGMPPSVREIAEGLNYRSTNNVRQHLRLIQQKGHIRIHQGTARGIEVVAGRRPETAAADDVMNLPIIGRVAAGQPIVAEENIEGQVAIDRRMFRGNGLFTLRVKGDSMQGIGVLDGDIVIVQQQSTAVDNEVVVAIIEGEATLKRYFRQKDHIVLRAENPRYADIIVNSDREVMIAGKMIGLLRKC
jgi:repressor LexA